MAGRVLIGDQAHQKRDDDHASEDFLHLCAGTTANAGEHRELTLTKSEEKSNVVLALFGTQGGCFGISEKGYHGIFPPKQQRKTRSS